MGLRSPPTQNQNTSDSDRSLDAATKAKASLAKRGISDHSVTSNLPVGFLQHLDLRKSVYGYIDREDCTLFPLIRPGSLVQIDARQRKVSAERWRTEFDRPIYFVELRNGCVCSWCQVDRGQLIVIPHPHSHQDVRRFDCPSQAEIVGRVTAITMRIVGETVPEAGERPAGGPR